MLWQTAKDILPKTDVARFNQALMELGSLVCKPTDPRCGECPIARFCAAIASNLQHEIPRPKARQLFTDLREAAVVVRKNGRVLVRECGKTERWAGLWDFPRFELESEGSLFAQKEIVDKVRARTGITCALGPLLKTIKHGVTRYRITLDCYEAKFLSGRILQMRDAPIRWTALDDLAALPLSTTGRKIARLAKEVRR